MPRQTSQDFSKDFSKLVGRPYDRVDCWNLVREFYMLIFGIEVGQFYGDVRPSAEETQELIKTKAGSFERVEEPKFGDLMLMRIRGLETHIGIYVSDTTFFHSIKPVGSCVERLDKWKHCIVGYYRHRSMID